MTDSKGLPTAARDAIEQREDIFARRTRYREQGTRYCTSIHERAQKHQEYAGYQQWPEHLKRRAAQRNIPMLVLDQIGPFVGTMTGKMQTERLAPKIVGEGDVAYPAEALGAWVTRMRESYRAELVERQAFRDLWIAGAAAVGFQTIIRGSRVPRITARVIPIWELLWDPDVRQQNFLDRAWHAHGRYCDATQFRDRFGVSGIQFEELYEKAGGDDGSDSWPTDVRNSFKRDSDEVFIWTLEWRDVEPMVEIDLPADMDAKVVEMITGSRGRITLLDALRALSSPYAMPYDPQAEKSPLPWQLSKDEWLSFSTNWRELRGTPFDAFLELERDVYMDAVMAADEIIREPAPRPQNSWGIHFMTDELIAMPTGYEPIPWLTGEIDRQNIRNAAISGEMETAGTAPKNLLMHKPGAFPQIQTVEDDLGRPGARVEVTDLNAYKFESQPPYQGYRQIMDLAGSLSREVTLDPYSTGQVDDLRRTAYRSVQLVTQSANSKHSGRFSGLSLFREETTRMLLRTAVADFEVDDVRRVIGASRAATLNPDKRSWIEAERHGVTVDESPYTVSELDELFKQLFVEQGGAMRWLVGSQYDPGLAVMAELIGNLTGIPLAARQLWRNELLKRQEQQEQMERQQQEQAQAAQAQAMAGEQPPPEGQ